MDSWGDIIAERDNQEYDILVPTPGVDKEFLTPVRARRPGLQILVDKFGTSLPCRETGTKKWLTASDLGFKVTYQRKNLAIAKRRLQENGLNTPNFDPTGIFSL
ncbi:MAG: hypothetical protein CEE38_07885 [Planctomycetes bacterium B3_Pla]|nr:MAG: hypothetical protein CEE38_07885 [Planctomycetes bacterium B3_Pla]